MKSFSKGVKKTRPLPGKNLKSITALLQIFPMERKSVFTQEEEKEAAVGFIPAN